MRIILLLCALIYLQPLYGQRLMPVKNIWTEPQVHIHTQGYIVSFAIRDIDRTLQMMRELGDSSLPATSNLDTSKQYHYELTTDIHLEYHYEMQRLLHNCVASFLLSKGKVVITRKGKKLKEYLYDATLAENGTDHVLVTIKDPTLPQNIYIGKMPVIIRGADMGIDYY